jgi:hypothetical protein
MASDFDGFLFSFMSRSPTFYSSLPLSRTSEKLLPEIGSLF